MSEEQKAITRIKDMMTKLSPAIRDVSKGKRDPVRLTQLLLSSCARLPNLYIATQRTFGEAILAACTLDIEPDTPLGHCYILPFRNGKKSEEARRRHKQKVDVYDAQFILGYKGLVFLGYRSGSVKAVNSRVVYKGERWVIIGGTPSDDIKHYPDPSVEHSGKNFGELIQGAYTVIHTEKGMPPTSHWLYHDQIEAIRERDYSRKSGPWRTDYGPMAMKTCLKGGYKLVAISPDLALAIEIDSRMAVGKSVEDLIEIPDDLEPDEESIRPAEKTDNAAMLKNGIKDARKKEEPAIVPVAQRRAELKDKFSKLEPSKASEVLNAHGLASIDDTPDESIHSLLRECG